MKLPQTYLARIQKLLGDEFDEYLSLMDKPSYRGIRFHPLKCDLTTLKACLPFEITPSPFSPLSYYVHTTSPLGSLAAHHAGMFYAQEPSASCAVSVLAPEKGEKILDLCAAPGGKSSQIAACTGDTGLLWSNEIVGSRAKILSSNLERMGIKNNVISSCHPEKLCQTLSGFFDRVLVDAPCSGEGMFRRDAQAVTEWQESSPQACAARQGEILDSAAKAVRKDGVLVYSTCTFSPEENEDCVKSFLVRHPEFTLEEPGVTFGRAALGIPARRIFPMDGGEGHFVAKMRKTEQTAPEYTEEHFTAPKCTVTKEAALLFERCFLCPPQGDFCQVGDQIFVLPQQLPRLAGLNVLRAGYAFAQIVGKRLEPCHGAFLCHRAGECRQTVRFAPDDPMLAAYLRGEELPCDASLTGYCAVCVLDVPTGFGKASGGRLKNKYPKGLRNHN